MYVQVLMLCLRMFNYRRIRVYVARCFFSLWFMNLLLCSSKNMNYGGFDILVGLPIPPSHNPPPALARCCPWYCPSTASSQGKLVQHCHSPCGQPFGTCSGLSSAVNQSGEWWGKASNWCFINIKWPLLGGWLGGTPWNEHLDKLEVRVDHALTFLHIDWQAMGKITGRQAPRPHLGKIASSFRCFWRLAFPLATRPNQGIEMPGSSQATPTVQICKKTHRTRWATAARSTKESPKCWKSKGSNLSKPRFLELLGM